MWKSGDPGNERTAPGFHGVHAFLLMTTVSITTGWVWDDGGAPPNVTIGGNTEYLKAGGGDHNGVNNYYIMLCLISQKPLNFFSR